MTADRMRWHPGGAFAVLVSNQGKIICVDLALRVLPLQALSDLPLSHTLLDLNPFFRHKPSSLCLEWEPQDTPQSNNLGALIIDRTCVVLINFQLGSVTATQVSRIGSWIQIDPKTDEKGGLVVLELGGRAFMSFTRKIFHGKYFRTSFGDLLH